MRQIIYKNNSYIIQRMNTEELHEIANFVVRENYRHHSILPSAEIMKNEIESIYNEELKYSNYSTVYVVRNWYKKIIGCIRVFKWDKMEPLPIQKIFGIDPLKVINGVTETSYWHIGRFAIDSFAGISTVTLFKQLMVLAVAPIIQEKDSYMIAETDCHLLRVMNALGIETMILGLPVDYLASETVPVCSSKKGLFPFYKRYSILCNSD